MALTATTTTDLVGQSQTLSFYESGTLVDQITFSSNSVTFQTISSYNLVKSDVILYNQFIQSFSRLLVMNFPVVAQSTYAAFPLCSFTLSLTSAGVTHITFTQAWEGTTVQSFNYVPVAQSAGITARASPVTISLQEWFMAVIMFSAYTNQVSLN